MDIRSCRNCGKIFQFRGGYNCPDCVREIDELFVKVRDFMYRNPSAGIEAICEGTGATVDMMMEWMREGRLITTSGAGSLLKCTKCGTSIDTGQMCAKCAGEFMSQVSSASQELDAVLRKQAETSERRGLHIDRLLTKKDR